MKDLIASPVPRYCQKGVLIDTNILLLFLVGSVNQERITKFQPTPFCSMGEICTRRLTSLKKA